MRTGNVLAVIILLSPAIAAIRADDAADVLAQSWSAVDRTRRIPPDLAAIVNRRADVDVRFERPDGIWQLAGLHLFLERVTDLDLEELAGLTPTKDLAIDGNNQGTAQGFRRLAALPHLRRLGIYLDLNAADLRAISVLPHLEELDLTNYHRAELEFGGLAHLTSLRGLDLSNVGLTDSSMKYVRALLSLQKLNLRENNQITDTGVTELKDLLNLTELCLGENNRITDAGVAQLKGLQALRFLDLDKLGAAGTGALAELPHLERLFVRTYEPASGKAGLSVLRDLEWLRIGDLACDNREAVRLPVDLRRLDMRFSMEPKLRLQSAQRIEHVQIALDRRLRGGDREARDLKWLGSLPALRELTLVRSIESDVKAIVGLNELRSLSIEGSDCVPPIGNEGMRALAELHNLESLKIEDYYGGGNKKMELNEGLDVLPKLANLRRLELQGIPAVTTKVLANIWQLKQLQILVTVHAFRAAARERLEP
jgi:hypothetical protein